MLQPGAQAGVHRNVPTALGRMPSVRVSVRPPDDQVRDSGPSEPLVYLLQRDVAQLEGGGWTQ